MIILQGFKKCKKIKLTNELRENWVRQVTKYAHNFQSDVEGIPDASDSLNEYSKDTNEILIGRYNIYQGILRPEVQELYRTKCKILS
jgi:hypothetical protein